MQAQQLWLTDPAAPRHVGSSQTRTRTRVPCIGRQTPNHCTTREAPVPVLICFLLQTGLHSTLWETFAPRALFEVPLIMRYLMF